MSANTEDLRNAQRQGFIKGLASLGPPQLRLEIDDFIQDVDMTNLYLLAMIEIMRDDFSPDPFSWFQMGGIHGKPFQAWDGVQSTGVSNQGYCSHSSILFPTWHRPYIAMVEQSVFLKMAEIAELYPAAEQAKYRAAALRFRHPYWDPVMPRLVETVNGQKQYSWGPPFICMFPTVQLESWQNPGHFVEMPNPLYTFKFPSQANKFDRNAPMAWQATFSNTRQPHTIATNTIRGINAIGRSDHRFVMSTFGQNILSDDIDQPFTGGKVYNLLMNRNVQSGQKMGFGEFSNDGYFEAQGQNVGNQNSLEGFHDDIHVNTGSGNGAFSLGPNDRSNYGMGHMGLIEVAAFDPIFWLHHCNVDRICAIWQTMFPDEWFTEQDALQSNFVTNSGDQQTPSTPLLPFRTGGSRQDPEWFTSNDVRQWQDLGYDYAIKDTLHRNIPLAKASGPDINSWVNRTYQWASLGTDASIPAIGYPMNLAGAANLPPVWKIDGVGDEIPHDKAAPPTRHTFLREAVAAPRVAAQSLPSRPAQTPPTQSPPVQDPPAQAHPAQAVLHTDGSLDTRVVAKTPDDDWVKEQFGHLGNLVKDGKMTQWSVSVVVEKFALRGSFTIFFFLGDFPTDSIQWPHAKTVAGMDGVLVNTAVENCSACKQQIDSHLLVSDHIGLTPSLVKYWTTQNKVHDVGVANFDSSSVIPFLTRNLHWRVANGAGVEVPRDQVAGLKVQVNSQIVQLPQRPEDAPIYGPLKPWPEVTDNRTGGVNDDGHDRV